MSTSVRPSTHRTGTNGGSGAVKLGFPAPSQLATRTHLTSAEVKAVTESLNPLVADLFALYLKTKNFHWHLSGSHFRDYHLLFDEHADQIFAATDVLAERVRRVGGTTIRSISHISQLQTISDDNDDYVTPVEMVRRLMDDNLHLARAQRDAHEICDHHHDYATTSVLEVLIDEAERRAWFLFEVMQGHDGTGR
jgi:starvation-inducible DNA-binding protein